MSQLSVEQALFYPLAVLAVGTALGVVLARNPLHSALWLVCSFFFLAAVYVLLGAHFVGILQILVYTGAIMVLFLFVIMLLALSDAELGERRVTLFKIAGAGAAVTAVVMAARTAFVPAALPEIPRGFGTVSLVARHLFTELPLQFEAVSLLLLVAITAAVVVAKGRI